MEWNGDLAELAGGGVRVSGMGQDVILVRGGNGRME